MGEVQGIVVGGARLDDRELPPLSERRTYPCSCFEQQSADSVGTGSGKQPGLVGRRDDVPEQSSRRASVVERSQLSVHRSDKRLDLKSCSLDRRAPGAIWDLRRLLQRLSLAAQAGGVSEPGPGLCRGP